MKKVEERDGKMFIDGVEYKKVETEEVYQGCKIKDIEGVYEALDNTSVEIVYSKISSRHSGFNIIESGKKTIIIDDKHAQAIKSLIKKGIEKAREETKQTIYSWSSLL